MKIALCIPNLLSYHTFLRELASAASAEGHEVALFTDMNILYRADEYQSDSFCRFYHVPFPRGANGFKHLAAARELRRQVVSFAPDVLHAHFSAAAFTTALIKPSLSCPVIATIQGLITPLTSGSKRMWMRIAEAYAYNRMDAVWVLTDDDFRFLQNLIPAGKARIQRTLGFGCRLDQFDRTRFSPGQVRTARSKSGIGDTDVVFCFVGRRTHFKGFHLVARAFFRLLDSGVSAKLLLIGDYDPLHPTGLNADELSRLNNTPAVIDLGWVGDVASALAQADANVFPSTREGVPVNLMESLAMGVPVITVDSRGCRELVRHNIDGLVMPTATTENVEAGMRLLVDNDRRKAFSQAAVAGRSRFDRNLWIEEQIEIYREIGLPGHATEIPGVNRVALGA